MVGGLPAVVRGPGGAGRLADESRGAALVAEYRAPAAHLEPAAVREQAHRDGTGAGHQADALVQPRGGDEEFGVAHHEYGCLETFLQRGTDLGALPGCLAGVSAHGDRGRARVRGKGVMDDGGQPVGGGHGVVRPPAAAGTDVVGDDIRTRAGAQMCLGATHVDADHEGHGVLHGTSFVVARCCDGGRTVFGERWLER